jgi:hypothetical protein
LDDLVDLYKRVFARILSRADAELSPYSRYYIAASTPYSWKHIMTVFGTVLARVGVLEDGKAQSVPFSTIPFPYVHDKLVSDTTLKYGCSWLSCWWYNAFILSSRSTLFVGGSMHIRAERGKDLGWEPRPVVLEDWADEGIMTALTTLK